MTAIHRRGATNTFDYVIEVGKATISISRALHKPYSNIIIGITAEPAPDTIPEDCADIFDLSIFDEALPSPT